MIYWVLARNDMRNGKKGSHEGGERAGLDWPELSLADQPTCREREVRTNTIRIPSKAENVRIHLDLVYFGKKLADDT